ncbi:MAG TPA: hypothetical protein VD908_04905 [Cytophagales bacterium]|nr:hypothetical protein [Cytophagales bacterium]
MKSYIIMILASLGFLIFSCSNKEGKQNQNKLESDTITEVPDENVRPTGDSRSTENIDLDTTNKSTD